MLAGNKLKISGWGAQSPGREFCQYTRDSIIHQKKDEATLESVSCDCRQDKKMIVGEMVAAGKKNLDRLRLSADGFPLPLGSTRDVRRIINGPRRHWWAYCSGLIRAATELMGLGIIHIVLVDKEKKTTERGEKKRPRTKISVE